MVVMACTLFFACTTNSNSQNDRTTLPASASMGQLPTNQLPQQEPIQVGAERLDQYLPMLYNKRVGMVVNQTSMLGEMHLVDALLRQGIEVTKVFAPEHGFRGKADAGELVKNSRDIKTGLPIISLYGKNKKPSAEQLAGLDVLVFDIQDVGARFYTYISTMHYVMEAGAENGIPVLVLDRPNPNGHYVDGPILEPRFKSFVGMHPIPIVHGLTVGELAQMINQEGWLKNGVRCQLTVVPCLGYTHYAMYELPVKPSPNLPNIRSIYLYPSLCLFEGTRVSVGRGTNKQFQVIGSPDSNQFPYRFTPVSRAGAKYPKHEHKTCYGYDLTYISPNTLRRMTSLNLNWLIDLYQSSSNKANFFDRKDFFNKLAGTDQLVQQVMNGMSAAQIRASWQPAIVEYKEMRRRYLLYPDFE